MTPPGAVIRIVLADDHVTVRQGLKLLIEAQPDMQVVAEASDGSGAVEQTRALKPDVVVMDISMPGVNGLVATRALRAQVPGTAVVILTRHGDDAYLQELLRAGAAGYVLKQSAAAELHTAGLSVDRLTTEIETTLYRIAQEALTNVAKHAKATSVAVLLERRADHISLVIEDNGVGFDSSAAGRTSQGFGLLGMQERAALIRANLEIESVAGGGTSILVRIATPQEGRHA